MKMSHDDFEAWVREQSRACLEPREIDALCEGDLDPDSGEYTFREQAVQGQWEAWRAASEFHSLFAGRAPGIERRQENVIGGHSQTEFSFRVWFHPEYGSSEVEAWYHGLESTELSTRPITDWVRESLSEEDFRLLFDLGNEEETKHWQIYGKGTLRGWRDYFGEYDEELDIVEFEKSEVPEAWFGGPALIATKEDRAECRQLNWNFDGEGSWDAPSSVGDDGDPFEWRIVVCDDGTFAVNESDGELTDRKETFDSLPEAKAWCAARDEEFRLGDVPDES